MFLNRYWYTFPKWIFVAFFVLSTFGLCAVFSSGGGFSGFFFRQLIHVALGIGIICFLIACKTSVVFNFSYSVYAASMIVLILTEILGFIGMGAKRWINLYFFYVQPSEIIKVTLVLALARYAQMHHGKFLYPILMIIIPFAFIIKQPDLGTAMIVLLSGVVILFMSGAQWKFFVLSMLTIIGGAPFLWRKLHDYQKRRVISFLDPDSDPLGNGYQLIQSKIAIGSGGLFGTGFMQGTQGRLNFLPEKRTDCAFSLFCEEWGFVGAMIVIFIFILLISYSYKMALRAQTIFIRLLAIGISTFFSFHLLINVGMVMGIFPVVGVPLPFISYGGSSFLISSFFIGLLMCIKANEYGKLIGTKKEVD